MTFLCGIAGGSGSGKTTLARVMYEHLTSWGFSGEIISMDDFYISLSHLTSEERDQLCFDRERNYDHPKLIDHVKFFDVLNKVSTGKKAAFPKYDFVTHSHTQDLREIPESLDFALAEGNFALYSGWGRDILELYNERIFVSTNPKLALTRRIRRDIQERGRELPHVLDQLDATVIPMYEQFIFPTKHNADREVLWQVNQVLEPEQAKVKLVEMAYEQALSIYRKVNGSQGQFPQMLPVQQFSL